MRPRQRRRCVCLAIGLLLGSASVLADETVTITTFVPQQPLQSSALGADTLNPPGPSALLTFNTPSPGRLLVVWMLDVENLSGAPWRVAGFVRVNGVQYAGARYVQLSANEQYTIAGQAVVNAIVPAGALVELDWLVIGGVGGEVRAHATNTTLSTVYLK